MWCCGGCRCAAHLDARSCRGLCGMPALDGARGRVVCVASVARCWSNVATFVGGAEVDGLGDVEDIVADAVVARDRGGGTVMVVVLREE